MQEKKPMVLVVDDIEGIRQLLAYELERSGFLTVHAESGNEALKVFESEEVDLVLSDIWMPDGNGIELLNRVMEREADANSIKTPFIIFSGMLNSSLQDLYNRGASLVLSKPFDVTEMLGEVARLCKVTECASTPDLTLEGEGKELATSFSDPTTAVLGRGGVFIPSIDLKDATVNDIADFQLNFSSGEVNDFNFVGKIRWIAENQTEGSTTHRAGIEFRNRVDLGNVFNLPSLIPYIPCPKADIA